MSLTSLLVNAQLSEKQAIIVKRIDKLGGKRFNYLEPVLHCHPY